MRFIQTLIAGAAIVAGVLAQKPTIDTSISSVVAGEPLEIEYSPKTATAKFVLRKGDSDDLKDVAVITENATGGKFTWNVPATLVDDDDYALQIITDDGENYAGPARFEVTGGSGEESSSASSAASTASSAASTASSAASTGASTLITTSAASSGSPSASPSSGNSTVSSPSLSTSGSSRPTSAPSQTTSGGIPESTGAASSLSSSPIALIFGAIAAIAYLN